MALSVPPHPPRFQSLERESLLIPLPYLLLILMTVTWRTKCLDSGTLWPYLSYVRETGSPAARTWCRALNATPGALLMYGPQRALVSLLCRRED